MEVEGRMLLLVWSDLLTRHHRLGVQPAIKSAEWHCCNMAVNIMLEQYQVLEAFCGSGAPLLKERNTPTL